MESKWIVDWDEIEEKSKYIVCPINKGANGYFLAHPIYRCLGWEVKRLMERTYAAIEVPDFEMPEEKKV